MTYDSSKGKICSDITDCLLGLETETYNVPHMATEQWALMKLPSCSGHRCDRVNCVCSW